MRNFQRHHCYSPADIIFGLIVCCCMPLACLTGASASAQSVAAADATAGSNSETSIKTSSPTASVLNYAPTAPVQFDARDKASYYFHNLLSFGTVLGPAGEAAGAMILPPKHYPDPWRQGVAAYGRNYLAILGRQQTAGFSRFVADVALREDPRYYPSANRGFAFRVGHAIGFTLIDRSDSGQARPALANLIGAAAGGFVGNAYLPSNYSDLRHAGVRTGIQMGTFAVGNLFEEFAPEFEKLSHSMGNHLRRTH
ncbi:hypothetical protein ACPOL_5999 [Acidisarcina polymorpha]|uniref:Uncharacterized protein n=1 Tax=Acidisarcina polymorpha TaxID=2211140 RepID=A0A2Z5G7K4_9BACT|nr:hypothetical protein [Acidisarcina polymorpha]AXC15243.1 hypothetical protein ACPOL_5999 [Acidisarcina polymorpha]